jgi:hypothetical protein
MKSKLKKNETEKEIIEFDNEVLAVKEELEFNKKKIIDDLFTNGDDLIKSVDTKYNKLAKRENSIITKFLKLFN